MKTAKELADTFGVSKRTIRWYEQEGLIKTAEISDDYNSRRLYADETVEQLRYILMLKELDYSLKKIRSIMEDPSFDLEMSLLDHISELQRKKKHIERLIEYAAFTALAGIRPISVNEYIASAEKGEALQKKLYGELTIDSYLKEHPEEVMEEVRNKITKVLSFDTYDIDDMSVLVAAKELTDTIIHYVHGIDEWYVCNLASILKLDDGLRNRLDPNLSKEDASFLHKITGRIAALTFETELEDFKAAMDKDPLDLLDVKLRLDTFMWHCQCLNPSPNNPFMVIPSIESIIDSMRENNGDDNTGLFEIQLAFDYFYRKKFRAIITEFGEKMGEKESYIEGLVCAGILQKYLEEDYMEDIQIYKCIPDALENDSVKQWVDSVGGTGTSAYIAESVKEYCKIYDI